MPASSLQGMVVRACARNIAGVTDVADLPYDLVKPVLKKIHNPEQLVILEQNCPHIADADKELWVAFIARDIPRWQEKIVEPKNPRSWHKVYRKLVRDEKKEKEAREEALRAAMSGLKEKKEEERTTFAEKIVPEGRTKQKAFVDGQPNPRLNSWGIEQTPALRNAKKGHDVMNALRAQSKQAVKDRNAAFGKTSAFSTAKPMPNAKQQIKTAPAWMVRDLKQPDPKPLPAAARRAPEKPTTAFTPRKGPTVTERALDTAEREARLRALTQPKTRPALASPPAQATKTSPSAPAPGTATPSPPPKRRLDISPSSQGPAGAQQIRKRPAPVLFMPAKKRKI